MFKRCPSLEGQVQVHKGSVKKKKKGEKYKYWEGNVFIKTYKR